jgi:small subunit ribosomal protein S15
MAKMHSRKRGKSGSKRPLKITKPSWSRYTPKEIELLVTRMVKEGKTSSMIGIVLRDTYGIPNIKAVANKSIMDIMREKGLMPELPEDMLSLIKKAVKVRKHLEENHKDTHAIRGLHLTESKINRLIKYYKRTEVLPRDWKLDIKNIKMYAE